jgi:protein-S-isoprenylcysteine O-methyltransferase Ste14
MSDKRALLPPAYLFFAVVVMAALHFLFPGAAVVIYPLNLIGIVPLLAGVILNLMADKTLKDHDTTVKPFQESTVLITAGVFRICRHPMYLGMVIMLLGLAVLLGSLLPFMVIPIFAMSMELRFVRVEERMLEKRFGENWLEYKQRTRRWI